MKFVINCDKDKQNLINYLHFKPTFKTFNKMIIFTILGIITTSFFFIVILMSIIEARIKRRKTEKMIWKMDKVETRTGGLENDRLNERQ